MAWDPLLITSRRNNVHIHLNMELDLHNVCFAECYKHTAMIIKKDLEIFGLTEFIILQVKITALATKTLILIITYYCSIHMSIVSIHMVVASIYWLVININQHYTIIFGSWKYLLELIHMKGKHLYNLWCFTSPVWCFYINFPRSVICPIFLIIF